jgi:hypothetical protein
MPEQTSLVRVIQINYICDTCEEGEMLPTSRSVLLLTNPPLLSHVCNNCGKSKNFKAEYPIIGYEKIDES